MIQWFEILDRIVLIPFIIIIIVIKERKKVGTLGMGKGEISIFITNPNYLQQEIKI